MSNMLYKSDFNSEYFYQQNGVSCISTEGVVLGSKQQIVVINTKRMIDVMK